MLLVCCYGNWFVIDVFIIAIVIIEQYLYQMILLLISTIICVIAISVALIYLQQVINLRLLSRYHIPYMLLLYLIRIC